MSLLVYYLFDFIKCVVYNKRTETESHDSKSKLFE